MSYIARRVGVGLGKETTRGTAVSPSYFFPLTDYDFDDKNELAVREGRRSVIESTSGGDVVKKWSEGSLSGNIYSDGFGLLLYSALGALSSAAKSAPNTAVYDHTFSVAQSNTHQSITVSIDDPVAGDKQYAGAVVNSLEIKGEVGSYVTFTADLLGKTSADGTVTSSYTTEYLFRPQDVAFYHASAFSGLGAASATSIRSFTLKIEKNAEANYNLGSAVPSDFYNKQFSVTLDVELLHSGDTFRDLWTAGTAKAYRLGVTNSDQTIGSSSNPALQINLYSGQITEWSRSGGNDDLFTESLTIRADYDTTNSAMISAILTNLVTSY